MEGRRSDKSGPFLGWKEYCSQADRDPGTGGGRLARVLNIGSSDQVQRPGKWKGVARLYAANISGRNKNK